MHRHQDAGTGRHRTHEARNHLSGILLTKAAFKLELEQDEASSFNQTKISTDCQGPGAELLLWHPWDSLLGYTQLSSLSDSTGTKAALTAHPSSFPPLCFHTPQSSPKSTAQSLDLYHTDTDISLQTTGRHQIRQM